ncbi:MAG: TIGR03768 family metallophosphoesterase [Deltaproteobacteria bacterium]|nr:TIGR03768 family metallophosphoesterase [Deltaproteobacteria bacterium]
MKRSYENNKFASFLLMGMLIFSLSGCGDGDNGSIQGYSIDSTVATTTERMLSFPWPTSTEATGLAPATPNSPNGGPGLAATELCRVSEYDALGYGAWTFGAPLPSIQRMDIMPAGYNSPTPTRTKQLTNFFAITDIHITDEEAPNQIIYLQQFDGPNSGGNSSIYSPVMMYTAQVLDAAMQTVNALHKQNPFDFGISLGDTCNSTSYNELRWYIDVVDGGLITPSSGDHAGANDIDYQKPFLAAGLDKSIPWYQTLGNHDHFYLGSFPVDADPALGIRQSYISDTFWAVSDFLVPNFDTFPALFDMQDLLSTPTYYMGLIDGSTRYGNIINAGAVTNEEFSDGAPSVVADPDRRSLVRTEWIQEFFDTSSYPVGHGFNLVDSTQPSGFACYSFLPKSDIPLKVIVLDDTQSETDGSNDIHGHGYLDAKRWEWLQAELAAGQAANQLMIIAAHVPIAVAAIGAETEWWLGEPTTVQENRNAVTLAELVQTLQSTPNFLMWIAGHRHLNTVKAFISSDPSKPEQGFWQVETSSLRDFPQQFRTFEIVLNSDYTISIVTTNVDPAVAEGTPAATSRKYAIATQQIVQTNLTLNNANVSMAAGVIPVPSMDPTRPQGTPTTDNPFTDPSIQFVNLSENGVPYNASYNAELFKQLSPETISVLQTQFQDL